MLKLLEIFTKNLNKMDGEVIKFAAWMAKIQNHYYSDDEAMSAAFERVTPLKYREV